MENNDFRKDFQNFINERVNTSSVAMANSEEYKKAETTAYTCLEQIKSVLPAAYKHLILDMELAFTQLETSAVHFAYKAGLNDSGQLRNELKSLELVS